MKRIALKSKWILIALLVLISLWIVFADEPLLPAVKTALKTGIASPEKGAGEIPWSQDDPEALNRYIAKLESGEQVFIKSDKIHLAFIAQLSSWIKQGGGERVLNLIELSNESSRKYLNQGPLSERALALDYILLNARMLNDEIPKLKNVSLSPALIESFAVPDVAELFQEAIDEELRLLDEVGRSMASIRKLDGRWYAPFMFRRRETLNHFYKIATEQIYSDCQYLTEDNATVCAPAMSYLSETGWWNSAGRNLLKKMKLDLISYRREMELKALEVLEIKKSLAQRL